MKILTESLNLLILLVVVLLLFLDRIHTHTPIYTSIKTED